MKKVSQSTLFLLLTLGVLSQELPKSLVPSHYNLDLVLDPTASTYDGMVEITFESTNAVTNIARFHVSQETIVIKQALLNYQYECNTTDYNAETEVIVFQCPANSILSNNKLVIHFQGKFSTDDMVGLYKSTYNEDGVDQVLLATQFESEGARKAFPCFDEPTWKATFDIFITHPDDYIAVANTPAVKQFPVSPNQIQTHFERTPLMSTYLVALTVSKFIPNVNNKTKGYDYEVFSRPSAKDFTNTATTYGPTLIDLLSNWTGIDYKDLGNTQAYQVAIPDFAAGAMENWGLITYREVDLLDEKDHTSDSAKQRIITTIAHELSHQWFGDYVTLDWWSDTWLNEGFATYFEYYIPSLLDDNLDTMRQFVVKELQPVLQVDAIPSALPLTSNVTSAAEIDDKFDDISYSKGGSVVRMLRNIVGETAFRNSLHSYLTNNKYNNTSPTSLLNSVSTQTALGIEKIMDNWIYQSGFPLVSVIRKGTKVILTQERFTIQNSNATEETQWYIPISYTTSTEKDFNIYITDWLEPNSTVEIDLDDKSWIIVNIQQAGYYRVNYEDMLWHYIIEDLHDKTSNIDVLNRAELVDDIFNIARAGHISYEMVFHLAEYLGSETDYYPWVSAFNALSFISGKLDNEEAENLLKSKTLGWIDKAFPTNNTKPGTGHVDKLKEVLILDWACKLGQKECVTFVNETFENYKTNRSSLSDYNKRNVVFCYGYRFGSNPSGDYDFLFNLFKNSTSAVEQNEIISSLGCTEDADMLSKYLSETIKTNSSIRKQDAALVFKAVYTQSTVGVNVSLNFLENNLDKISTVLKGLNALPNLILGLANKVTSHDHIDRLKKVIEDNSNIESVKLVGQRAVDIITANRNWTDTYAAQIKKILKKPPSAADAPKPTIMLVVLTFIIFYLNRQ